MNPFRLILKKIILAGFLISLLGGAVLIFPNAAVQASAGPQAVNPPAVQTPAPQNGPGVQEVRTARLERLYQRELRLLDRQAARLERIDDLTVRAQQLIDRLKEKGVNTQVLEEALADFKAALPAARSAHNRAMAILEAHVGFNDSGKMTDAAAARETVKTAGEALKEAHKVIRDGFRDLLRTVRQYRQQNRDQKPAASPAPGI